MEIRGILFRATLLGLILAFFALGSGGIIAQDKKKSDAVDAKGAVSKNSNGKSSNSKTDDGKASDAKSSDGRMIELVGLFKLVLSAEEPVVAETKNLIVLTPKSIGKRAQEWAKLAEKHRDLALKTLDLDDEEAQEAKVGIFIWANADQLKTYIRRVEKRSPEKDEVAVVNPDDWVLRAAGLVGNSKEGTLGEHRAGEMVAAMMIGRKAKRTNKVPEWLTMGFGRATTWKLATPSLRPLLDEKRRVAAYSKKWNGWQVICGEASGPDSLALQASAVYYLAFGPSASKFTKFVEGFQLDDNNNTRSLDQVIEYSGIEREAFSSGWQKWVVR